MRDWLLERIVGIAYYFSYLLDRNNIIQKRGYIFLPFFIAEKNKEGGKTLARICVPCVDIFKGDVDAIDFYINTLEQVKTVFQENRK